MQIAVLRHAVTDITGEASRRPDPVRDRQRVSAAGCPWLGQL
jgi:hypothetical protein